VQQVKGLVLVGYRLLGGAPGGLQYIFNVQANYFAE
jgi:hypothetical protein